MQSQIIRTREHWIDWAKCLLILFVVIGHAGLKGFSRDLLFTFHMPAFFIVSGYLYKPRPWKKTVKSFVLPIVAFSIMNLLFMMVIDLLRIHSIDWNFYSQAIWKAYYSVVRGKEYVTLFIGVWFLIVLLACRLLLGDVSSKSPILKYYKEIAILMTTWVILEPHVLSDSFKYIKDIYLYRLASCFPFMALGMWLRENSETFKRNILNVRPQLNGGGKFLILGLLLFFAVTINNGYVSVWSNNFGNNNVVFFANATLSSLILFYICAHIKGYKFVEVLSNGTLLILGIHNIMIFIGANVGKVIHLYNTPVLPWLIGFATLLISYYPIQWCEKHCPWLLGK